MEVFSSRKGKVVFWSYLVISFTVLIYCLRMLSYLDYVYDHKNLIYSDIFSVNHYVAGNFVVAIPLSYIIMLGLVIVKVKNHRAMLQNSMKFEDYPIEEQEKELSLVFCSTCKSYPGASFERGAMEEGMRIIYCKCKKCRKINKHRIT